MPLRLESEIELPEQATPASPPANKGSLYFKADGLYTKDSAGVERKVMRSGADITEGVHITGKDTSVINGYTGMLVIAPPTSDEEVQGAVYKMPDSTWGVGQDYAEGNYEIFLSDGDNDDRVATSNLETISGVTNATPPVVTTSTTHGWETGDIVRITGTGIVALDNKFWKITVTGTTTFSLNGATASGASATGYAYSDRSAILHRLSPSGWGSCGAMHLAPGLRGRSGQDLPLTGLWLQPAVDIPAIIIDNPFTTVWGPTPVSDIIAIRDNRGAGGARNVLRVDAEGQLILRNREGAAANPFSFQLRNEADTMTGYATSTGIFGGTRVNIIGTDPAQPLLQLRQPAGMAENLLKLQTSAGATMSYFDSSGTFHMQKGTQAWPGISFKDDDDTGIYWYAEDTIGFTCGGSLEMAILPNLLSIIDGTNINFSINTGTKIGNAANQKLSFWGATPRAQLTGWADPTGTASRTTFATASVTLPNLAQKVMALILDLKSVGLLGA